MRKECLLIYFFNKTIIDHFLEKIYKGYLTRFFEGTIIDYCLVKESLIKKDVLTEQSLTTICANKP